MTDRPHPLAETEPMEAKLVDALPAEAGWQYEPKWDGFRAIASRLGDRVELRSSRASRSRAIFPEIVAALHGTACDNYVLDGELILPIGGVLSFDALQARLHPAESRILRLSGETPAQLMLFDCLALAGSPLIDRPLTERRNALERLHARDGTATLLLSPRAPDLAGAQAWLDASGGALDGVIAKPLGEAYRAGERAMLKVNQHRTADCVVGGFRRAKGGSLVASLLLGLYDDAGLLNHVGFTSALAKEDRAELTGRLEALIAQPGFTGKAPGRSEPLERRQGERVVPTQARVRRGGQLRSGDQRTVSPWHRPCAMAPGQGAAAMPDGTARLRTAAIRPR